eukprot:6192870-Pleurochrysis_carterae.AAC.5
MSWRFASCTLCGTSSHDQSLTSASSEVSFRVVLVTECMNLHQERQARRCAHLVWQVLAGINMAA